MNWTEKILEDLRSLNVIFRDRSHEQIQMRSLIKVVGFGFRRATQISDQLQDMVTLVQGPPGTGKTSLISALVLNYMVNQQPWLLTAETHYAVKVCADRIARDLRARNLAEDSIFLFQRASIERAQYCDLY